MGKWLGIGGAVAVLLIIVVGFAMKVRRFFTVPDTAAQELFPVASTVLPVFPARGPARTMERGVRRYDIHLGGGPYPGHAGTMWLYLPERQSDTQSLPCVLTAPAGTPLVTGMDLGDGDVPEHLPYVRAGFAVLAYDLDGACQNFQQASDQEVQHLNCPLLLFHAMDDSNVPASESQQCADRLKQAGKNVTLITVPTGDHYESMIQQGIPTAINWLTQQGAAPKPPTQPLAAAPPPARAAVESVPSPRQQPDSKTAKSDSKPVPTQPKFEDLVIQSGPAWEVVQTIGRTQRLLRHKDQGYRIEVPVFWEVSRHPDTVTTVNPSAGRKSVLSIASTGSNPDAFVRIETYAAEGDEKPLALLQKWDRAAPTTTARSPRKSSRTRTWRPPGSSTCCATVSRPPSLR
jgi:hypothetical protein